MLRRFSTTVFVVLAGSLAMTSSPCARADQPFVPGTGDRLDRCFDDFEDSNWRWTYNHPKSSYEQDENQRAPGGFSNNKLWHEGAKRGTPDLVKRVPTPPGGIEGSTGSLMFATKLSGIPGRISRQQQQDDLLMKIDRYTGGPVRVAWQPSCTVRVYLPPFEKWENRTGPSFGMRTDCIARNREGENEHYWPGMFLLFRSKTTRNKDIEQDHAKITVRADKRGRDARSYDITEPGWWTMGMSFTPDGQVHYYASPGVDDLTEADYLMSSYPYGYRALAFDNFFFNVANWETGNNWSTAWIIDDPMVFVIPPQGRSVAQVYRRSGGRSRGSRMTRRGRPGGAPGRRAVR